MPERRGGRWLIVVVALAGFAGCSAPRQGAEPAPAQQTPAQQTTGGAALAPADAGGEEGAADEAPMMEEPMDEEAVQLMDEQASLVGSLDSALRLANCGDAFGHRDAICDLSERICSIAEDHPRAVERCEDAQLRCASARERVSDECE